MAFGMVKGESYKVVKGKFQSVDSSASPFVVVDPMVTYVIKLSRRSLHTQQSSVPIFVSFVLLVFKPCLAALWVYFWLCTPKFMSSGVWGTKYGPQIETGSDESKTSALTHCILFQPQ